MKKLKFALLMVIVTAATFTGCKDDENPKDTTRLEIRLTDAPGLYDEVNVDIQSIRINATNSEGSGWQTLDLLEPGVYNLMDFTNGIDTLLAAQDVPSGKISQIRLILGSNNSVVIDGQSYPMETPSAQQSGLKLNLHNTLVPDVAYRLWIDFDAQRSVVEKGNGGYSLKPVLRAYTEATGGTIKGSVTPAGADPLVWAILGQDSIMTIPNADGTFLIAGLTASSSWKVLYDADNTTGYEDQEKTGVTVQIGMVNTLDPVVLQK